MLLIHIKNFITVGVSNPSTSIIKCNIQEVEHENKSKGSEEHWNWSKEPHEERKWEVEGTQAKGPEVAASVHSGGNILSCEHLLPKVWGQFLEGHVDKDTCMAIVPYGLHIQQKCQQKAHQYGEELYGQTKLTPVPKNLKHHGFPPMATAHQHSNEGTQHYSCGSQKGRCHYVVPQWLHC